jgi:regulator-associated protein of mTOR
MRTTDDPPLRNGDPHPNPLASHAPTRSQVNGMAPDAPAPQHMQQQAGASSSRPGTAATNRSVTRVTIDEQHAAPNGASARPGLLRARSDFGPRHSAPPPESADEGSVDGHFKIRHGWDDQLNSEEYSNLLTSVRRVLQQPETQQAD